MEELTFNNAEDQEAFFELTFNSWLRREMLELKRMTEPEGNKNHITAVKAEIEDDFA